MGWAPEHIAHPKELGREYTLTNSDSRWQGPQVKGPLRMGRPCLCPVPSGYRPASPMPCLRGAAGVASPLSRPPWDPTTGYGLCSQTLLMGPCLGLHCPAPLWAEPSLMGVPVSICLDSKHTQRSTRWSWALGRWGELSPKGRERTCQAGRPPDWRWGWGRSLQEAQGQVPEGILWRPQHPLRAPPPRRGPKTDSERTKGL